MPDIRLSEEALEHLKRLAKGPAALPDSPGTQELWDIRFVMGTRAFAHITQRGMGFMLAMEGN